MPAAANRTSFHAEHKSFLSIRTPVAYASGDAGVVAFCTLDGRTLNCEPDPSTGESYAGVGITRFDVEEWSRFYGHPIALGARCEILDLGYWYRPASLNAELYEPPAAENRPAVPG